MTSAWKRNADQHRNPLAKDTPLTSPSALPLRGLEQVSFVEGRV
jgi:hypothetical protein